MTKSDSEERSESPKHRDPEQEGAADDRPGQEETGSRDKPQVPLGCLAIGWSLLRRLIVPARDPPSDTTAAAAWLMRCARHAQFVQPHVLKVSFRPISLAPGESIDVPSREDAIDAAEEDLRDKIEEVARQQSELDAERARRSETPGAPTDSLDDQKGWREDTERQAREQLDRADSDTQPQPADDTQYQDTRAAGKTRIEHQICTFWEDRSFREGNRIVPCCFLKYIWVLPVAHITINPWRRLYIRRSGTSEDRISGDAYDRLTPNQQGDWIRAEPYSVEEHERAHARDYQERLKAYLAGEAGGRKLRYREFVVTAAEWAGADTRVRSHVRSIVELFYAQYVLADQQQYPHGFSESEAIDAQSKALDRGKSAQEDRFTAEDEESAQEIQRAIDLESRVARCPHHPEATPHCLQAV